MNFTPDELIAIHAEQRAKERYGVELSDADRVDMVAQVKDGRGLFFKKKEGSSKVSIWLVWWPRASRIVPIYYKAGRVLTVLPPDAFFGPTPAGQPSERISIAAKAMADSIGHGMREKCIDHAKAVVAALDDTPAPQPREEGE